ncbi:hypothetical protein EMIT0P218_30190 [Pseudomonas sp. IT-P218]
MPGHLFQYRHATTYSSPIFWQALSNNAYEWVGSFKADRERLVGQSSAV